VDVSLPVRDTAHVLGAAHALFTRGSASNALFTG
jgi:hypothetical protein